MRVLFCEVLESNEDKELAVLASIFYTPTKPILLCFAVKFPLFLPSKEKLKERKKPLRESLLARGTRFTTPRELKVREGRAVGYI